MEKTEEDIDLKTLSFFVSKKIPYITKWRINDYILEFYLDNSEGGKWLAWYHCPSSIEDLVRDFLKSKNLYPCYIPIKSLNFTKKSHICSNNHILCIEDEQGLWVMFRECIDNDWSSKEHIYYCPLCGYKAFEK